MAKSDEWTSVAVRRETLRRLKRNLRGGESMDRLLRKMEADYEPRIDEEAPAR